MSDPPQRQVVPAAERLITPAFVVLAAATLAFFVGGGIVLPVAPQFAAEVIGANEIGVGVAIGAFSIAALILRPVVGWSSDRFGGRPLLVGGSILTVAALALHLLAADPLVFIGARAMLGAGEGFFLVAALASGSDLAPPTRRGRGAQLPVALALPRDCRRAAHRRGLLAAELGYGPTFLVSAALAGLASALLVARRSALEVSPLPA